MQAIDLGGGRGVLHVVHNILHLENLRPDFHNGVGYDKWMLVDIGSYFVEVGNTAYPYRCDDQGAQQGESEPQEQPGGNFCLIHPS
jgi:hypothetical protein